MKTAPAPDAARDPGRLLRTALRLRCPACGQGRLFARAFEVRERCETCGVRFERDSGSFTGPVVLGYTAGALVAAVAGLALWARFGLFPGIEWAVAGIACAAVLALYRPLKAAWIWLLWATGLVFRDPPEDGAA